MIRDILDIDKEFVRDVCDSYNLDGVFVLAFDRGIFNNVSHICAGVRGSQKCDRFEAILDDIYDKLESGEIET